MYPKQVLQELKYHGFNISTSYWAPEVYDDLSEFITTLKQHHLSEKDAENNIAVFVLCENRESFKKRINGEINDLWLTKQTFNNIAQDCYDVLNRQNDLEDWQIKLRDIFRQMI